MGTTAITANDQPDAVRRSKARGVDSAATPYLEAAPTSIRDSAVKEERGLVEFRSVGFGYPTRPGGKNAPCDVQTVS